MATGAAKIGFADERDVPVWEPILVFGQQREDCPYR
jgi:hypothetical protein